MSIEKTIIDKDILRKKSLLARANLSIKQKEIAAKKSTVNFLKYVPLKKSQIISIYYPVKNEISCLALVKYLEERKHKICLPVVIKKDTPMVFKSWQEGDNLKRDLTKIPAPNNNAPIIKPDIIIMPLVAFDASGARLGYGKGYYDRTIASMNKKPLLVGYAYAMQEVEHIKQEAHDVPLDYLVSEKEVRKF